MTRFPPLPDSRDIGICLPVGTFSSPEPSPGLAFLSEGFSVNISNINNNIVLTFDIFVVTTGLGFLTQRLALRIAGDEGSDSDAVLSAHDALGRCHVNLKYFTLTKYFKTR